MEVMQYMSYEASRTCPSIVLHVKVHVIGGLNHFDGLMHEEYDGTSSIACDIR